MKGPWQCGPGLPDTLSTFALIVFTTKTCFTCRTSQKAATNTVLQRFEPLSSLLVFTFRPSIGYFPTHRFPPNLSSLAVSAPAFADGAGSAWLPFLPPQMVRASRPIHHKQVRGLTGTDHLFLRGRASTSH